MKGYYREGFTLKGDHLKWVKIMLLIAFSFGIIILTFLCMYLAWRLTLSFGHTANGIITVLGGITGFGVGSIAFWRLSVKLLEERGASKFLQ